MDLCGTPYSTFTSEEFESLIHFVFYFADQRQTIC